MSRAKNVLQVITGLLLIASAIIAPNNLDPGNLALRLTFVASGVILALTAFARRAEEKPRIPIVRMMFIGGAMNVVGTIGLRAGFWLYPDSNLGFAPIFGAPYFAGLLTLAFTSVVWLIALLVHVTQKKPGLPTL